MMRGNGHPWRYKAMLSLMLLGGAALAGVFGIKKGLDAKSHFERSEVLNRQAREIHDSAKNSLAVTHHAAQEALANLGRIKFAIYKSSLIPFVDVFTRIQDINFQDGRVFADTPLEVTQSDMLSVQEVSLKMQEIVTTGIGSLGVGGLVGLAVHGGMGLLGATSTGAAIGTVTAGNATLAGLGGGVLAAGGCGITGGMAGVMGGAAAAGVAGCMAGGAGGMAAGMGAGMAGGMAGSAAGAGMAGGATSAAGCLGGSAAAGAASGTVVSTAVVAAAGTAGSAALLGGVVVGPALAVGGMVMASKGQDARGDAQANYSRAHAAAEQFKSTQVVVAAIQTRAKLTSSLLSQLDERFQPCLSGLQQLVINSTDYSTYAEPDKKRVMVAAMLAKTLKNVMETPVIDESGAIAAVSRQVLKEATIIMAALSVLYENL